MARITGGTTLSNLKKSPMAPTSPMGFGRPGSKGVRRAGAEIADIPLGTLANMEVQGTLRGGIDASPGQEPVITRGGGVNILTPTSKYLKNFGVDLDQVIVDGKPKSFALSALFESKPLGKTQTTLRGRIRQMNDSSPSVSLEANIPFGR